MTIDLDTYSRIRRLYLVEKRSQRAIARELGISRKTVARYCRGEQLPGDRKPPKRQPTALQELVEPLIRECLEANQKESNKKQRMTAKDIWRYLTEEKGISIGESYVRQLVARLKQQTPEGFIPLSFEPGEAMQVDWADAKAVIGGEETAVSLFCAVLPFSYAIFAAAFPNKTKESFFTGHVLAFDFFGGVPRRCIYEYVPRNIFVVLFPGALCAGGPRQRTDVQLECLIISGIGHIIITATRASLEASHRTARRVWCGLPPKYPEAHRLEAPLPWPSC